MYFGNIIFPSQLSTYANHCVLMRIESEAGLGEAPWKKRPDLAKLVTQRDENGSLVIG